MATLEQLGYTIKPAQKATSARDNVYTGGKLTDAQRRKNSLNIGTGKTVDDVAKSVERNEGIGDNAALKEDALRAARESYISGMTYAGDKKRSGSRLPDAGANVVPNTSLMAGNSGGNGNTASGGESPLDILQKENSRLKAENTGLKKHDTTVSNQISSGATAFGSSTSGSGSAVTSEVNTGVKNAESTGTNGGMPEYEMPDIEALTQEETERRKSEQEKQRQLLEEKLGIIRKNTEEDIAQAEADLQTREKNARQAAVNMYFGGLEGVTGTDTVAITEGIAQGVRETGMREIMQLKRDLEAGNLEAEALLMELDDAQKDEIISAVEARVKAHNEAYEKSYELWKDARDYDFKVSSQVFDQYKWSVADDRAERQMEQEAAQFDKNFALNEQKYLSSELRQFSEKYGGRIGAGIALEHMQSLGVEFSSEAIADFMEKVDQDGIRDAILDNAEYAEAISKLEPSAREYLLKTIPDQEEFLRTQTLIDGLMQDELNEQAQKLEEYEAKKRIDQKYKSSGSGGGSSGGNVSAEQSELINYALRIGMSPLEFKKEYGTVVGTSKDAREKMISLYNGVFGRIVEDSENTYGPLQKERYLLMDARERDRKAFLEKEKGKNEEGDESFDFDI